MIMTSVNSRVFSVDAFKRIHTEQLLKEIKESKNWTLGIQTPFSQGNLTVITMFASGLLGVLTQNLIVYFGGKDKRAFIPFTCVAFGLHSLMEHESGKREKITRELIRAGDHFAHSDCQELAQGLWTIAKTANAYAEHANTVRYSIAGMLVLSGLGSLLDERLVSPIHLTGTLGLLAWVCYNVYANRINDSSLERIRKTVDFCLQQLDTQQKQPALSVSKGLSKIS
jgi:hypothetical protein